MEEAVEKSQMGDRWAGRLVDNISPIVLLRDFPIHVRENYVLARSID